MKPSVGRIIHVAATDKTCFEAIVTAVLPPLKEFDATVFAPHGPYPEAARRITIAARTQWHDPRECINEVL